MIKEIQGVHYKLLSSVIVTNISNDKISRFRGIKKAPNSSRVRCIIP